MVDFGLYVGYLLFSVALIFAVLLPLIEVIKSPKELVRPIITLAALLVLFLLSFALSGADVKPAYVAQGVDEGSSKVIGAALIMFYITFICAAVGIVVSELNKALR